MMSFVVTLLATASYFSYSLASSPTLFSSAPIPPTKDPWYTAPRRYEHAPPGAILRVRQAPGNLTSIFNASSAAYNVLYRTTNSLYQPAWAVTTLLVPANKTDPSTNSDSRPHALLSYQIPYNSPDLDASPSYSLYAPPDPALGNLLYSDVDGALSLGWYVNIPDFEGSSASFGAGILEGLAVLDSVRAVLEGRFGLIETNTRYAMWGYSGGSIASEWAAELQGQYAPELSFVGTAIGGLVTNETSIFSLVSGTYFAGLAPAGFLGITKQYPAAYDYLVSQLKTSGPYNATGFLAAANLTIDEAFTVYAFQDIFAYFVNNGSSLLQAPVLQQIFDTNGQMGYHGIPQMPLYVYKAVADELAPVEGTDALVERYCGVGVNVVYERNTIGGHLAEETNGDAAAFAFLEKVLGGTYTHEGCTVRNVAVNVTKSPL